VNSIFLSAGFPDPKRRPEFYRSADYSLITEAIIALVRTVLPKNRLILGDHPATSGIVYGIAVELGSVQNLQVFRSEYFADTPSRILDLSVVTMVPREKDRETSLESMRARMLNDNKHKPSCAFFIGGMHGVIKEFNRIRDAYPEVARFPVGSTGGAAGDLLPQAMFDDELTEELEHNLVYQPLFARLIRDACSKGVHS